MNTVAYDEPGFGVPHLTRAVRVLLISTAVVFVVQFFADAANLRPLAEFISLFSLSSDSILRGHVWQFATYMFLHSGPLHIFLNMLMLLFLGPEVERSIGTRRFVLLYLGSGILGGIGWVLISGIGSAPCVGASGAVFGLLGAFAALFPARQITLLLFFVLPVTMTARVLALGMGLFSLFMLFSTQGGGIAHAAHLAGGIAGYFYAKRLARRIFLGLDLYYHDPAQGWFNLWKERLRGRVGGLSLRGSVDRPTTEDVDRVLDKMLDKGFESLTRRERDLLDRASRGRQSGNSIH